MTSRVDLANLALLLVYFLPSVYSLWMSNGYLIVEALAYSILPLF